MFCSTCGNNFDDSAAFCPVCGAANSAVAPAAPVEAAPVAAPIEAPVAAPVYEAPAAPVEVAPVAAPVYEAPAAPVEAPAAPFAAPVAAPVATAPFTAPAAQGEFVAPVPQADFAAPAEKPKKKSKLPLILGIGGAALVAIIAVIVFVVVPMFNSPLADISKAVRKTAFETSGMDFVVEIEGEEYYHGSVSIGDSVDNSGFYYADVDGYGFGYADGTMYDPWEGEVAFDDEYWGYADEMADEGGFDVDSKATADGILNNKIEESAVKDLYNNNISNFESNLEEGFDESVALPDWDTIQGFLGDFAKDGLSEDALTIEKSKRDGNTVYAYTVDPQLFAEDFCAYAKNDARAEEMMSFVALVAGYDDVDEFIEELEEEDLTDDIGKIKGEIVINKDGYIVEFSCKIDGDEIVVKFSNFNNTNVTLDLIKDEIYYEYEGVYFEDDYYEDDYYEDDYYEDDYYEDDYDDDYLASLDPTYYNTDTYIMSDTSYMYLEVGETEYTLVECWGDDIPDSFSFNVQYPDGVEVEWGDWEDDGYSCYLYVTANSACDDTMIIELVDDYDNVYDYYEVEIYVY